MRLKIRWLMASIGLAAILVAVFRFHSYMGLFALVPFGIAVLIAQSGLSLSLRRRALRVGAVGTLLLPFLAAIWINHELWGYYVSRPAVDRRIVEAGQVETISRVKTVLDFEGRRIFSGSAIEDADGYIQEDGQEGDYYVLEGRILRALKDRQAPPAKARDIPASRLEGLYKALEDTGRLEAGEPGYPDSKSLCGIVVEALGQDGHRLLFVGARGREVSNDHYPYYEFVFTRDASTRALRPVSFQRFYFDVAGIEGVEWPAFLPFLSFLSLIPTIPMQGFVLLRGNRRQSPETPLDAALNSITGY